MILAAVLLAACSADDATNTPADKDKTSEIRLNAEVWRMMEGTRATFYNAGDVSGSFMVYAYYNTTTECYINGVVNYSNNVSSWADTPQRWPQNNSSLDFFAYMPTNLTGTCCTFDPTPYDAENNFDGYSAGTPRIVCTGLPMTNSEQDELQEFVWAMTIRQNKESQGENGVTMKFRHPFARIKFQLAANNPNIKINSITLKNSITLTGLYTGGTCTFTDAAIAGTYYYTTSSWSSLTGSSNFVMTLSGDAATFNNNPASPVPIGGDLIMIPQSWDGAIDVDITWDNWGESVNETLSTTAPTTWQPGYSYTYTFTINKSALKVDVSKFTEQW